MIDPRNTHRAFRRRGTRRRWSAGLAAAVVVPFLSAGCLDLSTGPNGQDEDNDDDDPHVESVPVETVSSAAPPTPVGIIT